MSHKKINVEEEKTAEQTAEKGDIEELVMPTPDADEAETGEVLENETNVVDEELAKLRAEAESNYDKYLRAIAELENYKKRAIRERADLVKYAGEGLARDILDIVDQLQLALKHEPTGSLEEFMKGVAMVHDNLLSILAKHQITGEDSVGKPFDPQKHEAMAMVPTADSEEGLVIEEFKRPYFFRDKLLRVGQVIVSKKA